MKVYRKLEKMREAIKEQEINSFIDLIMAIEPLTKKHKVALRYMRLKYNGKAVLKLIDLENTSETVVFETEDEPNAKEYLYRTMFGVRSEDDGL